MRRGDIVTVVVSGDYGKPRPAVIVQSDLLEQTDSVLVCLVTSDVHEANIYRLSVEPRPQNGLKVMSQVMAEKIIALPRAKCGKAIGRIDDGSIVALNSMLSTVLGLAD